MKAIKKPIEVDVWEITTSPVHLEGPIWVLNSFTIDNLLDWGVDNTLSVRTLEGRVWANPGDYIIRGPEGDIWPVRKDIFEKTYDVVEKEYEAD